MNEPEILQRRVYSERIAPFMRTPLVKVLVGARRVGKSCILMHLMQRIRAEEEQPNIIYINKEDPAFATLRTYRELNDYLLRRLESRRRNYIFIDEVQEIEEFGQDRAKRLENLVCNHLLFCGYDVTVGALATQEIDFVATRNGERLYVQVATELERAETLERELGNLLRIKDNYPKLAVTAQESHENTYEGVRLVGIREFLTQSVQP